MDRNLDIRTSRTEAAILVSLPSVSCNTLKTISPPMGTYRIDIASAIQLVLLHRFGDQRSSLKEVSVTIDRIVEIAS